MQQTLTPVSCFAFWLFVRLCVCTLILGLAGAGSLASVEGTLTNLLTSLNTHSQGVVVFDRLIVPKEVSQGYAKTGTAVLVVYAWHGVVSCVI